MDRDYLTKLEEERERGRSVIYFSIVHCYSSFLSKSITMITSEVDEVFLKYKIFRV